MKPINKSCLTALAATSLFISPGVFSKSTPEAGLELREAKEWNFQVFLNDNAIGFHNFRLDPLQDGYELTTEADFKVKFLFVTAYRYQHENQETWRNGCLERISARTNNNGSQLKVTGQRESDSFALAATNRDAALNDSCIHSFAYWDLEALKATRLLNSQTGVYQNVSVTQVGRESIDVDGKPRTADRYTLDAEGVNLDLWYSPEGEWLGLASTLEKGRQLRYQLVRS